MTASQDLLVEIGTEELPPKSLENLSEAFLSGICAGLEKHGLGYRIATPFATPRRLAVLIRGVDVSQPDRDIERRGPLVSAAFNEQGEPTRAAIGFARSCGVDIASLGRQETEKGACLVYRGVQPGQPAKALAPGIVQTALDTLPIPKRMRWGNNSFEFVRPIHWIVLMLGQEAVEAELYGTRCDCLTYGHRFHHPDTIRITEAGEYAAMLEKHGWVVPLFSVRKERIKLLVQEAAEQAGGTAVIDDELLKEVASLVEWPKAIAGRFEPDFLQVPAEALIATMKGNQKYFHMVDHDNKLMPYFIAVSNVDSRDLEAVKAGNERVIRPRLADAKFFWEQDGAHSLESRWDKLKNVIFEIRLGSLYDKSKRIAKLAGDIAEKSGADALLAIRAGQLCKCDLLTDMVGEFPELQGVMGEYYARHDGENPLVAHAIREHYSPRFWGDVLPESKIGQAVALADRVDTLTGIFGIGQTPTGDKDPYGLRRAALGVLRIMIEQRLPLDLKALLADSAQSYPPGLLPLEVDTQVYDFILERMRGYYAEQGIPPDTIEAVLVCRPAQPLDAERRIRSVEAFRGLPAAESLAVANKRIHNILKKSGEDIPKQADPTYFIHAQERTLYDKLNEAGRRISPYIAQGDYQQALEHLAGLRETVDEFFDHVMVMDKDMTVRNNRLALLQTLRELFLKIADISKLQHT